MEAPKELINYVEYPAEHLEKTRAFFENFLAASFTQWGADYMDIHYAPLTLGFYRATLRSSAEKDSLRPFIALH